MKMRVTCTVIVSLLLWPCLVFSAGRPESQPGTEELLDAVRTVVYDQEKSVDWLSAADSIAKLGDLGIREAGPLLVGVLRREVPLKVVKG